MYCSSAYKPLLDRGGATRSLYLVPVIVLVPCLISKVHQLDKIIMMNLVQLIANKALPKRSGGCRSKAFNSIQKDKGTLSIEEIVAAYLLHFRNRFNNYLGRSDNDTRWDEVWAVEGALLEANHLDALAAATTDRTTAYLDRRKERVLDFVWCMCRDASQTKCQEMRQVFDVFIEREERILKLYMVSYIECVYPSSRATQ
jgi:hypothetical protein